MPFQATILDVRFFLSGLSLCSMTSARISDDDIQSVFEVFDVDGTGTMDSEELLAALRSLGWTKATEEDVKKIITEAHEADEAEVEEATEEEIQAMRENRKNCLNYLQFSDLIRRKQRLADGPEEVLAAFKLFDQDHKGRINKIDLKAAGRTATGREVPDSVIDEIMRLADLDKDGFLTFEEFRRAVSKDDPASAALNSTVQLGATIANAGATKRDGGTAAAADVSKGDEDVKAETQVIAGVKVSVINGKLAKAEVRRALVVCGYDQDTLPDSVFDECFDQEDGDGDGLLTLDEYCKLLVGFGEQVDGY